ncbi:MAG: hypothetical protein EOO15_05780 [Chitinophagaceae bacterium]|nr:MAG: hypothetical protein EOO15_05780 [Chitinophagaceae bacterium]
MGRQDNPFPGAVRGKEGKEKAHWVAARLYGQDARLMKYERGNEFTEAGQGVTIEFDETKGEMTVKQGGGSFVFERK